MTREEMIKKLIADYIATVYEGGVERWIETIVRYGVDHKPYYDMTDEEIRDEYLLTFPDEEGI